MVTKLLIGICYHKSSKNFGSPFSYSRLIEYTFAFLWGSGLFIKISVGNKIVLEGEIYRTIEKSYYFNGIKSANIYKGNDLIVYKCHQKAV